MVCVGSKWHDMGGNRRQGEHRQCDHEATVAAASRVIVTIRHHGARLIPGVPSQAVFFMKGRLWNA